MKVESPSTWTPSRPTSWIFAFQRQMVAVIALVTPHADPIGGTDPTGMFTLTSTLSASSLQSMIRSGVGSVGQALRAYQAVGKVLDIFNYADLAIKMLRAIAQPTPEGAVGALTAELQRRFGGIDATHILDGFRRAFDTIGPHWSEISDRILELAPQIAAEASAYAMQNMAGFLNAQARGSLRLVLFLPTAPGGRGKETYINVGRDLQIAASPTGGRLFGFGVATSKRPDANRTQLFRIDYWDVRQKPARPTPTPLHVHYHIGGGNQHAPNRTIWP